MILSENRPPLFRIVRSGTDKFARNEADDYRRPICGAGRECSRSSAAVMIKRRTLSALALGRDQAASSDDDPSAVFAFDGLDTAETGQKAAGRNSKHAAVTAGNQRAIAADILHDPVLQHAIGRLHFAR